MDTGNDTGFKIGAGVKAWRRKRNLLQKELAARTGMNVTQLWSIENDRNSPSMRTVARIASALGITVPQLLSAPDGDAPDGIRLNGGIREQTASEIDWQHLIHKDTCQIRDDPESEKQPRLSEKRYDFIMQHDDPSCMDVPRNML